MQRESRQQPTEQTQAKAVFNLLQIALKPHEDSGNWQEKQISLHLNKKYRPHSHFRLKPLHEQHLTLKLTEKYAKLNHSQEKPIRADLASCPNQAIEDKEGAVESEFWVSRVNWMPMPQSERPSNSRLNRKRSIGFQSHGKVVRERNTRYENPEGILSREFRKSLAINLNKEQLKTHQKQSQGQGKQGQPLMQAYVRSTFDKMYERHQQENSHSSYKQSEQGKNTMIRKMLKNMDSLRKLPKHTQKDHSHSQLPPQTQLIREIPNQIASALPLRRNCPRRQQRILNLNLQAEKVYGSRSINLFTSKSLSKQS